MMKLVLCTIWPIIGIVGVLLYCETKEIFCAQVDKNKSNHPFLIRLGIRLMMPGLGLLMITQLLYGPFFSIAMPSRFLLLLDVIGLCMVTCGVVLGIWARESLGMSWAHAADYQIIAEQRLMTSGPYAYVRHPIYTALLMMFTGTQMIVSSWLIGATILLYAFMVWQSKKEESLWLSQFKEEFKAYQKRTNMFFPKLKHVIFNRNP